MGAPEVRIMEKEIVLKRNAHLKLVLDVKELVRNLFWGKSKKKE